MEIKKEKLLDLCWYCWNVGTRGLNKKEFELFLKEELDAFGGDREK